MSHRKIFILIFIISLMVRVSFWAVSSKTIGNDAAQYLGAARELVTTGTIQEKVSILTSAHFMPPVYPWITAQFIKYLKLEPYNAATIINVLVGSFIPVLVAAIVFKVNKNRLLIALSGILAAFNRELIVFSYTVLTEPLFITLQLLLIFTLLSHITSKKEVSLNLKSLFTGISLGGLFGLAYLTRSASIYLFPTILAAFLIITVLSSKRPWFNFIFVSLIFSVISSSFILWQSYRLYKLNGFLSLTPQASANLRTSDFRNNFNNDLFDLNKDGTLTNQSEQLKGSPNFIKAFSQHPRERVIAFTLNLKKALLILWSGLWPNAPYFSAFLLATILIYFPCRKLSSINPNITIFLAFLLYLTSVIFFYFYVFLKSSMVTYFYLVYPQIPQQLRLSLVSLYKSFSLISKDVLIIFISFLSLILLLSFSRIIIRFKKISQRPKNNLLVKKISAFLQRLEASPLQKTPLDRTLSPLLLLILFIACHVLFYALVNTKTRYIDQIIPLSVAVTVILIGFAMQHWRKYKSLSSLLIIFAVIVTIVSTGRDFFFSLHYAGAYSDNRNKVQGQAIKSEAYQKKTETRVLCDSYAVAYYANAACVRVPYTEADPQKIFRYFNYQQVDFIAVPNQVSFGKEFFPIPTYWLAKTTASIAPDWLKYNQKFDYFTRLTDFAAGTQYDFSLPHQDLSLAPGRYLLVFQGEINTDMISEPAVAVDFPLRGKTGNIKMQGYYVQPYNAGERKIIGYVGLNLQTKSSLALPQTIETEKGLITNQAVSILRFSLSR